MSSTSIPARDDVRTSTAAGTPAAAAPAVPSAVPAAHLPVSTRTVRRTGVLLTAGSLSWAASFLAVGGNPTSELGVTVGDLAALPFQAGLFALLSVQLRTRAAGVGRFAVGFLRLEFVLLALATLWTVLHGFFPAFRDDLWLAVLDAFWPLSMLGMAIIGVKIAFAGRWRGALRAWPAVAETWAPVCVPIFVVTGGSVVTDYVGAAHLLLGYVTLGVLLVLRPTLTGARDS